MPTQAHLVDLARRALTSTGKRVRAFEVDGVRMFAKRLEAPHRHWFTTTVARRFMATVTGFPLPPLSAADVGAAWGTDFELRRLDAMSASGVRVAQVLARAPDLVVLEDAGLDIARRLETWSRPTWRRELARVAEDLAKLHRAGHWHGAAQIKNVSMDTDGGFRRLDFEENAGALLPLPIIQTSDLLQFLNTIALAGPIDERESESLLSDLVERYFAANPAEGVKTTLRRGLPYLRAGLGVTSVLGGHRSRKGVRRAQIEERVLSRTLGRLDGAASDRAREPS